MKLYGIHKGSVHEGGGMGYNVYLSKERVKKVCKLLVNDEQLNDLDVYGDEIGKECPIHKWKEVSDGRWTNGVDEIKIQELELITETDSHISISSDSNGTIKL